MPLKSFLAFCCISSLSLPQSVLFAADKKADPAAGQRETVAKPLTEKERKRREKELKKELEGPYKQWLTVDVT